MDTFGHFFGGAHAGCAISRGAAWASPTGRPASPIGQNWTHLDTFLECPRRKPYLSPRLLCLTHRPPCIPNWTQLDTFGHFFWVPTPEALCLAASLVSHPQSALHPQLDTIRHIWTLFGECPRRKPYLSRRRLCLTYRPPCIPNWTQLDTFGHFFEGAHALLPYLSRRCLCLTHSPPCTPNRTESDTFLGVFRQDRLFPHRAS